MGVGRGTSPGVVSLAVMTTALMAVGTLVPFVFSALGPSIVADFDLSRAEFGFLTTALFAVAAVLSATLGRSTDRVSVRITYGLAFLVAALTLGGIAAAPNYLVLVVIAALGGISQALVNPLSNKLVADHAPRTRRGLIMGVKQSGVQMGAVVAGFSLPLLAVLVSWRAAVASMAVLVVAGWLAIAAFLPSRAHATGADDGRPVGIERIVVMLGAYAFLMGSVMAAVQAYLPLFAHEIVGLTPAAAGTLVAVVGFVGVGSRIILGHMTDRAGDVVPLLNAMAAIGAVSVTFVLLSPYFGQWMVWAGAVALGWSAAWNAVAMVAVVRVSGAQSTGRASGHVLTGFFAGFIAAPLAFGAAVDVIGYTWPWVALLTVLVAISVALSARTWRNRRRSRLRARK